jgi:hypothetical protein
VATADHRHRRVGYRRTGDDRRWAPESPLGPSPDRHQVPGPASIRAPPVATSRPSVDILAAVRPAQLSRSSRGRTEPSGVRSPQFRDRRGSRPRGGRDCRNRGKPRVRWEGGEQTKAIARAG